MEQRDEDILINLWSEVTNEDGELWATVIATVGKAATGRPVELEWAGGVWDHSSVKLKSLGGSLWGGEINEAVAGVARKLVTDHLDVDLLAHAEPDAANEVLINPWLKLTHPINMSAYIQPVRFKMLELRPSNAPLYHNSIINDNVVAMCWGASVIRLEYKHTRALCLFVLPAWVRILGFGNFYIPQGGLGVSSSGWTANLALLELALALEWLLALDTLWRLWLLHLHALHLLRLLLLLLDTVVSGLLEVWLSLGWIERWERHFECSEKFERCDYKVAIREVKKEEAIEGKLLSI